MDLQFFLAENADHHLRVIQTIIPAFVIMPSLTLKHPLSEMALSFTTASLVGCQQVNGMIDCLRRGCEVRGDAGIMLDAECMVLAISMLFQWLDVAQLLSLFEAGKGFNQILESYLVSLRDYLVIVLQASLLFRRIETISD